MLKIFQIELPESLFLEEAYSYMVYSEGVRVDRKCVAINPASWVKFDTYHNFIPYKKIKEITNYRDFGFGFKGQGECQIEVFGVVKDDHYTFERFICSKTMILGENSVFRIEKDLDVEFDLLYVKVTAITAVVLKEINFIGELDDELDRCPKIGYVICTYNREKYVKQFVDNIGEEFSNSKNIEFYVVVNGNQYVIEYPSNFTIIKNRNLGGAGGFALGMIEACQGPGITHILLADDDIKVTKASILRTISILKGLKPEYSDCFISGAMLSYDQRWLQYERTSSLNGAGFSPKGAWIDVREKNLVEQDIINKPERGLAGWWYCVIPKKVIAEFGYPWPVFVRGDDVEYSLRCSRRIITINGICVWHEPFIKKYNELMEDYYLVRNMLMISYLHRDNLRDIRKIFFLKKAIRNLIFFDYPAVQLNLRAAEALFNHEYELDSEKLHSDLMNHQKNMLEKIEAWKADPAYPSVTPKPLWKKYLMLIGQYVLGFRWGRAVSGGGFERRLVTFLGRSEVVTYQGRGLFRLYRYSWSRAVRYFFRIVVLYGKLSVNEKQLSRDIQAFRNKYKTKDEWLRLIYGIKNEFQENSKS